MAAPVEANNRGALLPSGHMRPFEEMPDPPTLSLVGNPEGFVATLGDVPGALSYEVRYRLSGDTALAWTRLTGTETLFEIGVDPGEYTVQAFATTQAGLSGWSAAQTVTVA
jgi:hypothetical protein